MLEIGQIIMYRRNVCKICDIIQNFRGNGDYYKLAPCYDSSLIIHAPVNSPKLTFRPLLTKAEIDNLVKKIPAIECADTNERTLENTYKGLFNSENHESLICIIKTAYVRGEAKSRKGQKRCEKDKIYFQKAEKALYGELAIVLGKSIDDTRSYIIEHVAALSA